MKINIFNSKNKPSIKEKDEMIDFLFTHLEKYRDPAWQIEKAINYSLQEYSSWGGFVLQGKKNNELVSVLVMNHTGMSGYIPENILVYVATHKDFRGQGLGKKILQKAIQETKGDIALHVEAENPAKNLYEHLGFTNPYLEMRLKK